MTLTVSSLAKIEEQLGLPLNVLHVFARKSTKVRDPKAMSHLDVATVQFLPTKSLESRA